MKSQCTNTVKLYFGGKIFKVVFEWDDNPYWFRVNSNVISSIYNVYASNSHQIEYMVRTNQISYINVEDWLVEQNMRRVEDDFVLFSLRWQES